MASIYSENTFPADSRVSPTIGGKLMFENELKKCN